MKIYAYPATIKKSLDGTYDVQFVNFKEGFTYGNNLEEARENACELLSILLESYLAFKKALPAPTTKKGAILILPDVKTQAALALYESLSSSKKVKTLTARTGDGYLMGSCITAWRSEPLAHTEIARQGGAGDG